MSINLHPAISSLRPYIPGRRVQDIEREYGVSQAIKLASNENALGPSPKALAALDGGTTTLHRYPDGSGSELRLALAECHGVSSEQILLGNGSDELIALIVKTIMGPGEDAIVATPSFSIYETTVRSALGHVITVPLTSHCYDLETMTHAVTPKTRLFFICNPNNPTGTTVTTKQIRSFLTQIPPNTIVVIDEAYGEYVTDADFPDSVALQSEGYPIIVLRTFSKIYGLAGLRIGYAIAPGYLVEAMNRIRLPFNTNTLAQQAALAALNDKEHLAASRAMNIKGKALFYNAFAELGLPFLRSEANFVYVDTLRDGNTVFDELLRLGVIVRHIEHSMLRITVGLPAENDRFLRALRDVLGRVKAVAQHGPTS